MDVVRTARVLFHIGRYLSFMTACSTPLGSTSQKLRWRDRFDREKGDLSSVKCTVLSQWFSAHSQISE